jgi:hypothetical protein
MCGVRIRDGLFFLGSGIVRFCAANLRMLQIWQIQQIEESATYVFSMGL